LIKIKTCLRLTDTQILARKCNSFGSFATLATIRRLGWLIWTIVAMAIGLFASLVGVFSFARRHCDD
jgi:hypothetical protein